MEKSKPTDIFLGRLSLLTEQVVAAAAASEIKTGKRIGLGWNMKKLEFSQFGRQKCEHRIIPLEGPGGTGMGACFDDAYHMNPRKCKCFPFWVICQQRAGLGPSLSGCAEQKEEKHTDAVFRRIEQSVSSVLQGDP